MADVYDALTTVRPYKEAWSHEQAVEWIREARGQHFDPDVVDVFLECALALGEADASLAWVAGFYMEHNWLFCHFPQSFQRELYAERSFVRAPALRPGLDVALVGAGHQFVEIEVEAGARHRSTLDE